MHAIELLDQALEAAANLGFRVRTDWLGEGVASGACRIKGQKWLFLDLSLSPREQLAILCDALRGEPAVAALDLSPPLRRLLDPRKSA